MAEGKATARRPDPTEHGCKHNRRPIRLLTVVRALQGPRHRHETVGFGSIAGEPPDRISMNAGNLGAPRGVFDDAVLLSQQISPERLETDAITREKCVVVPV